MNRGERVLSPIEDQVVGELALLGVDLRVRRDVCRVDDRHIQPRLHAVMEEHGIEHGPRMGSKPEGNVGDSEARQDAGQLGLDARQPFDRVDCRPAELRIAGRERERQRVEHKIGGIEAVFADADPMDPARDLELPLRRLGHPLLVDRQRDQDRPVEHRERNHLIDPPAPVLEVDRVDDCPPGTALERGPDHGGLGRVDRERRRHSLGQELDQRAHLLGLVGPLGQRDANVQQVGAAFDLLASDLEDGLVVVGEEQALDLA